MSVTTGTVSRGIKAPIIKKGDNLTQIVADSVLAAASEQRFELRERDVVAVTEAVVARAQGNYASIEHIAADVKAKFPEGEAGLIFPILSRNRFSICLKGIAMGLKKITLMLSYPGDEVGNALVGPDCFDESGVNPHSDILTEKRFVELFGHPKHLFTGVNYIEEYKEIIKGAGCEAEIIFANFSAAIVQYCEHVIYADIHTRSRTRKKLLSAGAKTVYGLEDILKEPVNGSGYNKEYGILGSNKASETQVKLFPINCDIFVKELADEFMKRTGKRIEVMVYGDGAFKDPAGFIWELADPVVSPAYTPGLIGVPNELKLKYLADSKFADLSGEELKEAIALSIREKEASLVGNMLSEGTTPRRYPDLLGSLADLTSGSGDKGTPIVLIQSYFDNYTD